MEEEHQRFDNIEISFVETVAKSDLSLIAKDVAELGIDSILDAGILRIYLFYQHLLG